MPLLAGSSIDVLDTQELLGRCLGKQELAQRVLARFRNQLSEDLTQLERALLDGDATLIARVAHRIKGAAANVSARCLHEQAAALECAARTDAWGDIPGAIDQLASECDEFFAVWEQLL